MIVKLNWNEGLFLKCYSVIWNWWHSQWFFGHLENR